MQEAGNLSILFDVGGVVGGAFAGSLSDRCGASASVSALFVFASLPAMFLYRAFGHLSLGWNVFLMAAAGCFVNGPYALITTAVSADLGNHSSVAGASPRMHFASGVPGGHKLPSEHVSVNRWIMRGFAVPRCLAATPVPERVCMQWQGVNVTMCTAMRAGHSVTAYGDADSSARIL